MYSVIKAFKPKNMKITKNLKVYICLFVVIFVIVIIVFALTRFIKPNISEPVNHYQKIIYFGQTCDLQNNTVSEEYSNGYQLAFSYINRNGGINGYNIKLILLNDSYEPDLAVKNAKLLIDYYNVLGIVGTFGTPTTLAIIEHAIGERPIPLIGPYSASTVFRKEFNPYIITTNTGFNLEFDLITENILQNSFNNISIIYQDDAYGHTFYNSYVTYIIERNLQINIVSTGKYERNSYDLEGTMSTLFGNDNPYDYSSYNSTKKNKIQAIVVFAAEKEIASILGIVKTINPNVAIYYGSLVGNDPRNVGYLENKNKTKVYQTLLNYSSIDKYPELKNLLNSEIAEYNKYNVKPIKFMSSGIIQGFYSGLMICKNLENFNNMKELNRKTFLDMFYKMKMIDVYGFKMGPFIVEKNNEAIKYAELNELQPNLQFKTIKTIKQ